MEVSIDKYPTYSIDKLEYCDLLILVTALKVLDKVNKDDLIAIRIQLLINDIRSYGVDVLA